MAKTIFYSLAAFFRKILFCHSKMKFISSRHRVISSIYFFARNPKRNMVAFCPAHPKWAQNPKFTTLSETTSIPTPFVWGVPSRPRGFSRHDRWNVIHGSMTSKNYFVENIKTTSSQKIVWIIRNYRKIHRFFKHKMISSKGWPRRKKMVKKIWILFLYEL